MKRQTAFAAMILVTIAALSAQNPLSMTVVPAAEIPLADERFGFGGGVFLGMEYRLPFFPVLSPRIDLGYSYLPTVTESGVNMFQAGGGLAARFGNRVQGTVGGNGGYYYGAISGGGGGNLYVSGFGGAEFRLSDALGIGARASYRWVADGAGGSLWSGLSFGIGARYTVLTTRRIQIEQPVFEPVFPVLYKYYAEESLGTITVSNPGSVSMTGLRVSLDVAEYMTGPTVTRVPTELSPGDTLEIPVDAVFSDQVLSITESDVVSGRLSVEYEVRGREQREELTVPIEILDRHAITWSDDRRAAAYVTAKDPAILQLVRPIAGWVRGEQIDFDPAFRIAIAVHTALGLNRINYVVDPRTPYIELSQDTTAVDYLQFPINTLTYRAGDCDDLSILYAAMLQASGVETAFLTIPGHIYLAFAIAMPPAEARATFLRPDDLIFRDGTVWVPLEVTLVQSSFLEAWTVGAEQWRSHSASDEARIFPVAEAWSVYSPVEAISTGDPGPVFPQQNEIEEEYRTAWAQFVNRETRNRVSTLESRIAGASNPSRYENSLGVLYARYGMIDRARELFERIVARRETAPALINLGNLYLMDNQLQLGIDLYVRALDLAPDDPIALIQLARANYALGRLEESGRYVDLLRPLAPEMVLQFGYLDGGDGPQNRAAGREQLLEVMVWDED